MSWFGDVILTEDIVLAKAANHHGGFVHFSNFELTDNYHCLNLTKFKLQWLDRAMFVFKKLWRREEPREQKNEKEEINGLAKIR